MKMHSPGHSSADSIDGLVLAVGDVGEALGATRVGEDLVAFLDVGEAVVEQGEHVGGDLLAEPVAGAEILVDPDLHRGVLLLGSWSESESVTDRAYDSGYGAIVSRAIDQATVG